MPPRPKLLPVVLLAAAAQLPAGPAVGQPYASPAGTDARAPGRFASGRPPELTRIVVQGDTVYYRDGVFFRLAPAGYVVIRAPRGARVPSLPGSAVRVSVGAEAYWYDRGTFYAAAAGQAAFVTVAPPLGCVVPSLPTDVAAIADINGVLYYLYAGTFYRPILADGKTAYLVADP